MSIHGAPALWPQRADLSGADLYRAKYSDRTIWSDGFDPQKAGAEKLSEIENILITPELARQTLKTKQHERKADRLAQSGKYVKSEREYKLAIEISPYEDEVLYMSLGGVLAELGRYEEAIQYLGIAHTINPYNERVIRNMTIVRMKILENG